MLVELLAWGGAARSCLLVVPQAVRTFRARQLDGVSAATYWIVLMQVRHVHVRFCHAAPVATGAACRERA